ATRRPGRRAGGPGGAADQRVLVRMSQRPVADRAAAREPPVGVILRRARHLRLLHGRADRVVAVDDQGGQQVVPAREVAVDRRGNHAHLPGDRTQREPSRAVRGKLPPCDLGDLPAWFGSDSLTGRTPCVHAGSLSEHRSLYESAAHIGLGVMIMAGCRSTGTATMITDIFLRMYTRKMSVIMKARPIRSVSELFS